MYALPKSSPIVKVFSRSVSENVRKSVSNEHYVLTGGSIIIGTGWTMGKRERHQIIIYAKINKVGSQNAMLGTGLIS